MEVVLDITVPGQPVPQPRQRFTARHGIPRAYTKADHPIHAYRQAVELLTKRHGPGAADGGYAIEIEAVYARPASHWKKAGLASGAPEYPGRNLGDWDNVAKGVLDAITVAGTVWRDDSQVVEASVRKRFASRREEPRTRVVVRRV